MRPRAGEQGVDIAEIELPLISAWRPSRATILGSGAAVCACTGSAPSPIAAATKGAVIHRVFLPVIVILPDRIGPRGCRFADGGATKRRAECR
ncbi:MAG: hypothetical protein EOP65_12515 [Sphingomonas sp.]|nr:MAG: hypothetical protein EOP65_12515 [Sphingomonas sp.]